MSGEIDLALRTIAAFDLGEPPDRTAFPLVFAEWVRFEWWSRGASTPASALDDDFQRWFDVLRADGVERLQLAFSGVNVPGTPPDRHRFGFSNATGAFLVGTGGRPQRWRALWKVGNREHPDRRIWHITFQGMADEAAIPVSPPDTLSVAKAELDAAFEAAAMFARGNDVPDWGSFFDRARSALGDPLSVGAAGVPVLPERWRTAEARRLLLAAQSGNGFGGMGSWNDVGLRDAAAQAAYEDVSQRLFGALLRALVAGANTS